MFIERIAKNSNIYGLKTSEFLKGQDEIAKRYLPRLKDLSDIDIIDKYILQIIEEIWEVKNSRNYNEKLEEICDVVMYTGSLYTIICGMINLDVKDIKDEAFIETSEFDPNKIIDSLISFRRCFPSRKWHKNEKISIDGDYIKNIGLNLLKTEIINIFAFLTYEMEEQGFNFIKYILNKQKYIYELNEVTIPSENFLRTITKEELESKQENNYKIVLTSEPVEPENLHGYPVKWVNKMDEDYLVIFEYTNDVSKDVFFHNKNIKDSKLILLKDNLDLNKYELFILNE